MPRVPIPERKVQERLAPMVQAQSAPLSAFGGDAGQTIKLATSAAGKAIDTGLSIFDKEVEKANDRDFFDADLKASELQSRLELKSKDYLGKNASTLPDVVNKEWTDGIAEIEGGITSSAVKERFNRAYSVRRASLDRYVNSHVSQQLDKYDDDQTELYIKQTRSEALNNYNDKERINLSLYQQGAAIESWGKKKGWSDSDISDKQSVAESATHVGILGSMLGGNDLNKYELAKNHYETNKAKLKYGDEEKAKKLVDEYFLKGEAQKEGDKIISNSKLSFTAALEQVNTIQDQEKRSATKKYVEDFFMSKRRAEVYDRTQDLIEAYNILDKNPDIKALESNPSLWMKLNGSQRKELQKYAESAADPETDLVTYHKLRDMAINPATRKQFMDTSLFDYKSKLSNKHFMELEKLRKYSTDKTGSGQKQLDGFRSDNEIINAALNDIDIKPNSTNKDTKAKVAQFRQSVEDAYLVEVERLGRKLNNKELQSIVDDKIKRGIIEKGIFWDTKKYKFELKPGEKFIVDKATNVSDIPADKLPMIQSRLNQLNAPMTTANMLKLYNKWVEKNGK